MAERWVVELRLERGTDETWRVNGSVRLADEAEEGGKRGAHLASVQGTYNMDGPVQAMTSVVPQVVQGLGVTVGDERRLAQLGQLLTEWAEESGGEGAVVGEDSTGSVGVRAAVEAEVERRRREAEERGQGTR